MRPALIALLLLLAGPALARLTAQDLDEVALSPPSKARLPLDLPVHALDGGATTLGAALRGRPALLVPVDFTCRSICGPALAIAAAALAGTGLRPGTDARLLVLSIDPKDDADTARMMTQARLGDGPVAATTVVLQADVGTTRAALGAIGFRAAYDPETDQFAHPAAAVTVAGDGRLGRVLSSLALEPRDLRLALIEAEEGRVGLADRVRLLCWSYDPARGLYTVAIRRLIAAAGLASLGALAATLALLVRRGRRQREAR